MREISLALIDMLLPPKLVFLSDAMMYFFYTNQSLTGWNLSNLDHRSLKSRRETSKGTQKQQK